MASQPTVWYVTTDELHPIDTLYVYKHNLVTGTFTLIYSATEPNDPAGDQFNWMEPPIDVAQSGPIRAICTKRCYDATYATGIEVFVFRDDTILNRTLIPKSADTYGTLAIPSNCCKWLLIDSVGNLHVLCIAYPSGVRSLYDFKSTDNGASFTPIKVNGAEALLWAENYPYYIREDISGNLWAFSGDKLFKSTNKGEAWSYVGACGLSNKVRDYAILNGTFFGIDVSVPDVLIRSSANSTIWTTRHTIANKSNYINSGILGYDGTYYYAIINYRTGLGRTSGYSEVYRSADGVNWSMISTIVDDSELSPSNQTTANLFILDNKLIYSFYYSEGEDPNEANVFRMAYWVSDDFGETWTEVLTPFYDMTHSNAVEGSTGLRWDSCPQAILVGMPEGPMVTVHDDEYISGTGEPIDIGGTVEGGVGVKQQPWDYEDYTTHISLGNNAKAEITDNGQACFIIDIQDMGIRGLKTLSVLEFGTNSLGVSAAIDYRYRRGEVFRTTPFKALYRNGVVTFPVTAAEFRIRVKGQYKADFNVSYVNVRWKFSDKRSIRGTYATSTHKDVS